ncbi:peptidoglycan-binding protein [Bartonella krasnovii]|uniref:Peptidoglycan-binding protein n=1 Tax=Bartonella krasnovii TaxID=2267275 RepID=A0A5B9CZL2_9HYPH|nr:peptidoglycan-binding protein [Bartonella krasnovii]QEE11707.1 peptidoglycan-binding protein [Bartonella krasnovii]UNF29466.1 peptidoglycan-binding protein [Bartonella krasnovii]UNF35824.1 peptidoglycan-binding protein [Bartonella krasnovii]UNF37445.1 peptidoglycan-binding protein [Bartonella krasnovii]UNF49011.1 peptidoglycan-binding protein [Bartonella krasnovii]
MATKRKTSRKKTVKHRKYHNSIVITLLLIIFYFIFWIAKTLYFYTRKNTLFFVGSILFSISFLVVSFNALFLQMTPHKNIFTQIKFSSTQNIGKSSNLSEKESKSQESSHVSSLNSSSHHNTNPPFPHQSVSMLEKQKELAKLGLYDGPLDGLDGPKTQRAIALWKQQATQKMQNDVLSSPATDEIAILIKQSEIEMANNTTKQNITNVKEVTLQPSIEDILQVQKALHNFGHEEVLVTGIEDQKTIEALKQFQKMFDLPITGKINPIILMKMREIGLLN